MIGKETDPSVGKDTQFKPGVSGNPKGKPKGVPHSKTRLLRLLELTEELKNPVTGELEGFTVAEQLDLQQIIKARRGDTRAYTVVMDRLEGKPPQTIDTKITGNLKLAQVEFMEPDGTDKSQDTPSV